MFLSVVGCLCRLVSMSVVACHSPCKMASDWNGGRSSCDAGVGGGSHPPETAVAPRFVGRARSLCMASLPWPVFTVLPAGRRKRHSGRVLHPEELPRQ